jgi:hypothetical protein
MFALSELRVSHPPPPPSISKSLMPPQLFAYASFHIHLTLHASEQVLKS